MPPISLSDGRGILHAVEKFTGRYPHTLESQYSQIFEKIVGLLGSNDLSLYLEDLLSPYTTSGQAGMHKSGVGNELYCLLRLNAKLLELRRAGNSLLDVAQLNAEVVDIWD